RQNNIPAPFTIYPGQTISLSGNNVQRAVKSTPTPNTQSAPPRMATKARESAPQLTPRAPPPRTNSYPSATNTRSETTTTPRGATPPGPLILGAPQWRWPASGTFLAVFQGGSGVNKGIDIAGNLGQPVLAAAAGQIAYAGAGLRGYGKLLIIKHN